MEYGDPTAAVWSIDSALEVAQRMLQVGKGGLGRGREATVWQVQAVVPLAGLVYAASPAGCGGGIQWVQQAIANADPDDVSNPGWARAALSCAVAAPSVARMLVRCLTDLSARQQDLLKMEMVDAVLNRPDGYAAAVSQ